jgi:hypothetical protein
VILTKCLYQHLNLDPLYLSFNTSAFTNTAKTMACREHYLNALIPSGRCARIR